MNPDGRKCQRHFSDTHKRTQQGRFIVQLPIIEEKLNQLGDSYETALKRFIGLERKLNNQPELKKEYTKFIQEYEELGHMKLVPNSQNDKADRPTYYLPHHAVIKESSTTTKLRVVFDESSKTTTGVSLNDTMLAGPTIQDDLFSIIARFRTHQYAITADITKMYRQVLLDPSQTSLQRILWRDKPHEEIRTYELGTLTYGTTSASYLAIRALTELAALECDTYPLGSNAVMNDFYVDDLLTGAKSIPDAQRLRDEVISVLRKGCFQLAKWASNCPDLVPDLRRIDGDHKELALDKDENIRTLGIQWNFSDDTFQYPVHTNPTANHITKRTILSSIAQIFDPLGLIGPVIVTAKILIQTLWQLKLDWDESVPLAVHSKWFQYQAQLPELSKLRIPRKILPTANPRNIQIHGFCDASQEAYGICIYIRVENDDCNCSTRLICSKSRVAPLKQTTIPRLELCGALLLAVQMNKLMEAMQLDIDSIYYWTDSTIVLDWIKSQSRRWNVFVVNRVGEIQELSNPPDWHHISTDENPADIISRGIPPAELIQNDLWWHGPPWLATDLSNWPVSSYTPNHERVLEQRKTVALLTIDPDDLCYRYSTLSRLTRITAYCLRFVNNSKKKKNDRSTGYLTTAELNGATNCLVRVIQASAFAGELKALTNRAELPRQGKLLNLNPFLDEQQIIRVGGRLQNSQLPYSTKHPIVLPAHHPFTKLLITAEHIKQLHAGAQATLAAIRARFWPLAARSLVKYAVRRCVTCFKAAPYASQGIMGNLPQQRVQLTRPFDNTGLDYFGPLYVREGLRRNSKTTKAYGAIFVCFATKAVHIELVSDMTSESFLNALKRFIGRRGKPSNIFSDSGTNFVGGNRELNELRELFMNEQNQAYIIEHPSSAGITWHFIPPQASNFGGIWEAAVKSAKHHLKRTAGESAALTFEEMQTLLTQIEAVLNSRPITPLSKDPNDLSYLTPGHFLIGDTLTANPEPNLAHIQVNRLSRWQRVEQIKQHFWKRWSKEYLNENQQRLKWKTNVGSKLSVGQLVIIRDDNLPPLLWRMGRVEMIHPGNDDIIRAATVKTSKGSVKRPAPKLCILPTE